MSEINDAFELPAAIAGWLTEYNRLKAEMKDLAERMDIARAHVELAMADNTMATVNGSPVLKWDYVESRRIDQKKLQELFAPEVLEPVYTVQRSRVFRPISQDDL
jgi:predicted phage-related endonuclease